MVVNFQDMVQKVTPVTNEHIWEAAIDQAIKEQFTYEKRNVHIVLPVNGLELSKYTVEKLKRMYNAAGWNIEFGLPRVDQREGDIAGFIKLSQGATYRGGAPVTSN